MHSSHANPLRLALQAARHPAGSRWTISCRAPSTAPSSCCGSKQFSTHTKVRSASQRPVCTAKTRSSSAPSSIQLQIYLAPFATRSPATNTPNNRYASTSTRQHQRATETVTPPDPTASYAAPITSSQDPNAPSSTSSPPPSTTTPQSKQLTWNAFLALRRTRRRYNLLASITSAFATTSVGVSVLARQNIEAASIFGLDPFIVLGLATAGSGAVGWLVGPFVGNAVFGVVYRGLRGEIEEVGGITRAHLEPPTQVSVM